MDKSKTYITDEEKINCQKVVDAYEELFANEDLLVLNAGKYGYVRLQYFKFPFGFDTADSFYDSKSLFDDLWEEWLHTQLINLSADTPMADMDYEDILKCLPDEKRKELLDKQFHFAEKTGIEGILDKSAPDLWSEEYMKTAKTWSRDWEHFDWGQIQENLCKIQKNRQEGKVIDNAEIGISLEELTEYFEWLHDNDPKGYYKSLLALLLVQAGFSEDEAQSWVNRPEELDQLLREMLEEND